MVDTEKEEDAPLSSVEEGASTERDCTAGADSGVTQVSEIDALRAKNAELEEKTASLNDAYLRKAADFENFRKRSLVDKQQSIEYANTSLLLDIIPLLDDFERAIKSAQLLTENENEGFDMAAAFKALLEGVQIAENRLYSTLENKWGLKKEEAAGAPFDPERHEALMMEKSADFSEPVVLEELQKGYLLKERVLRTAKVKVGMPLDA